MMRVRLIASMDQAAWACSRVPADSTWVELAPWQRETTLALDGLALQLHWADIYGGVGL